MKEDQKKIVVIGGGFIGTNLVLKLLQLNFRVIWYSSQNKLNSSQLEFRGRFINESIDELTEFYSSIFYLIGGLYSAGYQSEKSLSGQYKLLDFFLSKAVSNKIKLDSFFFFSSGGNSYLDKIGREDSPKCEGSNYSSFKQELEELVVQRLYKVGFKYYLIRPSNLYGARQEEHANVNGIIMTVLVNSLKGDVTNVPSNYHRIVRDYIYIDDFIDALLKIDNSFFSGPINISSGHMLSIKEIIETVEGFGLNPIINVNNFASEFEERFVSNEYLISKIGKLNFVNVFDGIKKTLTYLRS